MKVNAWKNIDVEVEVDVEIDDVLNECGQRVDEAEPNYIRRMMGAMDTLTRILARVSDELIAAMPEDALAVMHKRLKEQVRRYEETALSRREE